MGRGSVAAAVLIAAFALAPAPASAEVVWGYSLANDVMSPYCPGRSLADCPSPQAAELRQWILMQEAAGATQEEVEAALYERFGAMVLAAPRVEGFGAFFYLVPIAVFVGGGLLIVAFLRNQVRRPADSRSVPAVAPVDPELERLVDEEIARRA
ncbi:MAG: cytochrome c-type biogenesis protein CcmH [Proteobacteria bacterium]|nr:cytochrome c-type biogenesis protein CcmH [Pseudomonadota bacterium]